MHILTKYIDSSGSLGVSQRKRSYFTGIDPHIRKAHIFQYNGGITGGGGAKVQAINILLRNGSAKLRVVHSHCDGA